VRTVLVAVATTAALLLTAPGAWAQPVPPPNPSDQELDAGRGAVVEQAAELGRLSLLVADLDRRAGEARAALQVRREQAFTALTGAQEAASAATAAADRATEARVVTGAAGSVVDDAQERLDEFVTATYQQTLDLGPLGLLTDSATPEDLVARAEFGDLVAREQARAIDSLSRAFVEQVNAESVLRAAADEARTLSEEAERARVAADAAVEEASAAVDEEEAGLLRLDAERAEVEAQLQAVRATDERLRGQRAEYESYRERAAREAEEERQRAARAASAGDSAAGPPRAADLGPEYACRGGVPRWGPVKRWVSDAGQLLRCRFGIASVGGVGPRGRASDHPIGLGLDFFVDRATGDALADCALRNRGPLAVKYVIFRQRINSGSGWRQMEDRGSPVENHMEHVHISFASAPGGSLASVRC
jgi:hypothetical protein